MIFYPRTAFRLTMGYSYTVGVVFGEKRGLSEKVHSRRAFALLLLP